MFHHSPSLCLCLLSTSALNSLLSLQISVIHLNHSLVQSPFFHNSINKMACIFKFFCVCILFGCVDLNCATQDLWASLQHVGSSVVAGGIQFPDQGSNLGASCIGSVESQPLTTREVPVRLVVFEAGEHRFPESTDLCPTWKETGLPQQLSW